MMSDTKRENKERSSLLLRAMHLAQIWDAVHSGENEGLIAQDEIQMAYLLKYLFHMMFKCMINFTMIYEEINLKSDSFRL